MVHVIPNGAAGGVRNLAVPRGGFSAVRCQLPRCARNDMVHVIPNGAAGGVRNLAVPRGGFSAVRCQLPRSARNDTKSSWQFRIVVAVIAHRDAMCGNLQSKICNRKWQGIRRAE